MVADQVADDGVVADEDEAPARNGRMLKKSNSIAHIVRLQGGETALLGRSGRRYGGLSLGFLPPDNPFRTRFIDLVEWPWFDRTVLVAIVVNCLFLAVQGPPDSDIAFFRPALADEIESVFTMLFTVEMVCKIIALGFIKHELSYIRDHWNKLDFVVVTLCWLPIFFPQLDNYSAVRSVRALRPLRTVQRLPGMRRQVSTLILALPKLRDVAFLSAFIMVIFGVLGVQLFQGTLLYRCYTPGALEPLDVDAGVCVAGDPALQPLPPPPPLLPPLPPPLPPPVPPRPPRPYWLGPLPSSSSPAAAAAGGDNGSLLGGALGGGGGGGGGGSDGFAQGSCEVGEECRWYGTNPVYGTVSFDSIGWAWMTIFQCITLEGWVDVLYMEMAVMGPYVAIYFVALVLFGSFYVINLFLAVLWEVYDTQEVPEEEEHDIVTHDDDFGDEEDVYDGSGGGGYDKRVEGAEGEPALLQNGVARSDDAAAAHPPQRLKSGGRGRLPSEPWRVEIRAIVEAGWFGQLCVGLIVLNTAIMMAEYHHMPQWLSSQLEAANVLLTLAFLAEMVLKHAGLGAPRYWADAFNAFDGTIVILSVLELVITWFDVDVGVNTSVLRAFRLLRVFKLARSWRGLQQVLSCLTNSVAGLSNLFILLGLIIFIFSLLGMQFFGDRYTPAAGFDEPPRTNFDSIVKAMLTVFVVMSGENWNDVWADSKQAVGAWCAVYFVSIVVLGNFVMLNLFVAILLGGLPESDDEDDAEKDGGGGDDDEKEDEDGGGGGGGGGGEADGIVEAEEPMPSDGWLATLPGGWGAWVHSRRRHSLLLFAPGSAVRRAAHAVTCFKVAGTPLSFDNVIIAFIVVSSLSMTLESCDLAPTAPLALQLEMLNTIATLVFVAEMALKVVSLGLLFAPHAYLRSGWNRLDAFIVCSSLLALVGGGSPAIRVLRVLRVLRPLRLISRFGGMRLVIALLLRTMPKVIDICAVSLLFLLIFAILGVQLFAGKFASCSLDGVTTLAACAAAGGVWANPSIGSFDDVGAASLLLFEMAGMEGWPDVMYAGVDASNADEAPIVGYAYSQSIFFVAWIVVGGMFVVNLFVGIIVDTFAAIKSEDEGSNLMDEAQSQWVDATERMMQARPLRRPPCPAAPPRALCWRVIRWRHFDMLVLGVILFNTALIGLDGYGVTPREAALLALLNGLCTWAFVLEAALKVGALTFAEYLRDPWSVFDFSIVCLSLIEVAVSLLAAGLPVNPTLLRVLRVLRVARALRTVKSAKAIKQLLTTLVLSLPAIGNILGIFLIVQFMYAVLGMQLFGRVVWGEFLNADANFCTFGVAFLTMFRCATGESWNGIMHDAMVTPDTYDPDGRSCSEARGDCGSWVAIPFFVSYAIVAGFVVLNMMIAVVLENFSLSLRREANRVKQEHLDAFVDAWAAHDAYASGQMAVSQLQPLVKALPPPLGLDPAHFSKEHVRRNAETGQEQVRDADVTAYIQTLPLKTYQPPEPTEKGAPKGAEFVLFDDVLDVLTRNAFGDVVRRVEAGEIKHAESQTVKTLRSLQQMANAKQALSEARAGLGELAAVAQIQARWRANAAARARRKQANIKEAIKLRATGTVVPDAFVERADHSLVTYNGYAYIFGGRNASGALRDFWQYSVSAGFFADMSHTVPPALCARYAHQAAVVGSRMLVVGGHDGSRYLDDMWECDMAGLFWYQVGVPNSSRAAAPPRPLRLSPPPPQLAQLQTYDAAPLAARAAGTRGGGAALAIAAGRTPKTGTRMGRVHDAAATTMQAHERGMRARMRTAALRLAANEAYDGATLLQAAWRGHAVRSRRVGALS